MSSQGLEVLNFPGGVDLPPPASLYKKVENTFGVIFQNFHPEVSPDRPAAAAGGRLAALRGRG
ncbi:MAG: hypothetical protein WB421_06890 [Terriglobales bacterium]